MAACFWFLYNKTRHGKYMYAIGGNEAAAEVAGVNVYATKIRIYILASCMFGLAGCLLAAKSGGAPSTPLRAMSWTLSQLLPSAAVSTTGGVGTVPGILVGVLVFELMKVALQFMNVNSSYTYIVQALSSSWLLQSIFASTSQRSNFPKRAPIGPSTRCSWAAHFVIIMENFDCEPKPLPLGEVALRSNDGEGKPGTKEPLHSDKHWLLIESSYRCVFVLSQRPLLSVGLAPPAPPRGSPLAGRVTSYWTPKADKA